eukprot:1160073-Pelagomonas_calceolata.AAC.6
MEREPLDLPPSGNVHTRLPWPAQGNPPALKPCIPSQTKVLGSPAVSVGQGRQWLSTCGPFQLAGEPTDLHISNCNGRPNSYFIDGVSGCVEREVRARKFADAVRSRTCTPCSGVWMREPQVLALLLIV